jgi:glutaredoxin 3
MHMKVIVYSTQMCPWCNKTKEFLKKNKVAYKEVDVGSDQKAAQDMITRSGQAGVPVIEVDGEMIVGFQEDKLKKTLKIK